MTAQENIEETQEKNTSERSRETETLLTWKAPARPFKKRDREYYTTIGAIVFLLAVILLFLKEWLLIAVLIALAFVSYVLAAVPPELVEHVLTNKGIKTGGKFYPWGELQRFWFATKWDQKKVVVELKAGFPGRLWLMLGEQDREQVRQVMSKYLEMERPEPSWADRAARWLTKKVPLEG